MNLRPGDSACDEACEKLDRALAAKGKEALVDDTEERPGAKFATADLIGLPWQIIVGPKGLAQGEVEVKRRATGERTSVPIEGAMGMVAGG